MYYYIFKITEDLKTKLEKDMKSLNTENIIFKTKTDSIVKGQAKIKNKTVNFEIDLKSLLIFIETEDQATAIRCIYLLDDEFANLENYLPTVSAEHELICTASDFSQILPPWRYCRV